MLRLLTLGTLFFIFTSTMCISVIADYNVVKAELYCLYSMWSTLTDALQDEIQ